VEARVPFLDHRLVELLASIPGHLHPELFFNKRIVRDQLARSLPSYPRDKLKVKIYSTGKTTPTNRIRLELIRRYVPEFRQKCLYRPGAIFDGDRMSGYFNHVSKGGNAQKRDLDDFLNCMALTIFDNFCKELPHQGPPSAITPPSPLNTWVA
jgi:asparagine synthase (glutamine-hydrolysing)